MTNVRGGQNEGPSRGLLVKQLLHNSNDDWLSTIRSFNCASFNLFIWKAGRGAFVYSSEEDLLREIDISTPFTLSNATPNNGPIWPRQERILELYQSQTSLEQIM